MTGSWAATKEEMPRLFNCNKRLFIIYLVNMIMTCGSKHQWFVRVYDGSGQCLVHVVKQTKVQQRTAWVAGCQEQRREQSKEQPLAQHVGLYNQVH